MPRVTKAQREQQALKDAYRDGYEAASTSFQQIKIQQMQQAVELMKAAGSILSKAGYMIGKINGDNTR